MDVYVHIIISEYDVLSMHRKKEPIYLPHIIYFVHIQQSAKEKNLVPDIISSSELLSKGPVIMHQLGGLGNFLVNLSFLWRPPPPPPLHKFLFRGRPPFPPNKRQFVMLTPPNGPLPIAQPTNHYTSYSKWLSKSY